MFYCALNPLTLLPVSEDLSIKQKPCVLILKGDEHLEASWSQQELFARAKDILGFDCEGLTIHPLTCFFFPLSVYYFRPCSCCSMCFSSRVMAYKTALIPDTTSAGSSLHGAQRWIRNGLSVLQAQPSAPSSPPAHSGQAKGVRWKRQHQKLQGPGKAFHSDQASVAFCNSQTKSIKSLCQ